MDEVADARYLGDMEEPEDLDPTLTLPNVWSGHPNCELHRQRCRDLHERASNPWNLVLRLQELSEEAAAESGDKPRKRRSIDGPVKL